MTPERLEEIARTCGLVHHDIETAMYAQQCDELVVVVRLAVGALRGCERHVGEDGNPFERIPEILDEAREKGVPL